jgi:hypothetical protein
MSLVGGESAAPGLVYVAGLGHSGSTLLDLLLGAHPAIISPGELERLSPLEARGVPARPCACGAVVSECPYWRAVAEGIRGAPLGPGSKAAVAFWRDFPTDQLVPPGLRANRFHLLKLLLILGHAGLLRVAGRLSPHVRRYLRSGENSWRIVDALAGQDPGTRFVVDTSKSPLRLKLLHLLRPGSIFAIHLVRDGRAVVHSDHRRSGTPVAQSARLWVRRHRDVGLLIRGLPQSRRAFLRYEDLCGDPERELRRLLAGLGLVFDPAMLAMKGLGHGIEGSDVRFQAARRGAITLDERWRRELQPDDLAAFLRIAGPLNARLGYA